MHKQQIHFRLISVSLFAAIGVIAILNFRRLATTGTSSSSWPLCTEAVMKKENFYYSHHHNQGLWPLKPRHQCRLKFYRPKDFVACLDALSSGGDERLHFSFMGDSRVRQYYFNFLKFVPDYDHPWQDPADHKGKHVSRNISSPLLHDMVVSFYWQPVVDDEMLKILNDWADERVIPEPRFLLIGISVHSMAMNVGDDHVILARGLVKMVAVLEKLQRRCPGIKIIWLNQPPTIDFIRYKKEFYVRPFTVHSEKIHRYNQFLREHLKNATDVIQIWDSSNYMVEEYVRSCGVLQRSADQWIDTWMECTDYIHPGYAAMTQTTQILLNEMCNSVIQSSHT